MGRREEEEGQRGCEWKVEGVIECDMVGACIP